MSGENFLSCLSMCYEHVMVSLQKAALFHQFVERHLSAELANDTSAVNGTGAGPAPGGASVLSLSALGVPLASEVGTPCSLRSYNSTNSLSEQVAPMNGAVAYQSGLASANASSKANVTANDAFGAAGSVRAGTPTGTLTPGVSEKSTVGIATEASVSRKQSELRQTQTQMIANSKACLNAACDLTQRSISQLISLRKESNAKLAPDKMKFLWEISLNFVLQLEQISESTAYIMRQCLLSQTKSFLDYLHETCKGKLVVTLDNERWVQCDVSAERQAELDRLSSGKAFLPQSASQQKTGGANTGALSGASNSSATASTTAGSAGVSNKATPRDKESRAAVVDGVQYKVVWSVMLLTETALTYLEVAFNFSPVTADVINKIVELLRLFNSRTRQLVLGAQAIQSAARLKSISAKHLAVTGQSIGLLNALLPHIRAALLAQIPPKHQLLLTELDRVSHDLHDHHGQIVAKFVAIVSDFVDASATRLRTVDWDHFQGLQCEYFEEVQRNVLALHRVLQAILPPAQIQDVFSRIFALLNRKIPAHFEDVMPGTQTGRQRILDEVTHLVTAFSRMKQVDASALTDTLEETFRKRYVKER
jgi:vacuolar protein sorting-associated protein 54